MEVFGFGISGPELLVLILVMLLVLGPSHMAEGVRALARAIASFRNWSKRLRETSQNELGPLSDIDWQSYDPRKLDPRAMIRDAVKEEMDAWMQQMSATGKQAAASTKETPSATATSSATALPPETDRPSRSGGAEGTCEEDAPQTAATNDTSPSTQENTNPANDRKE